MNAKTLALSVIVWAAFLVGGCPVASPDINALTGERSPSWLDGDWLLDYSNSPNPTVLTFTNGAISSELANGVEPVAVLWATTAEIDGNAVSWSYGSRQTAVVLGEVVQCEGSATFEGTIQDDGTVAGTETVTGTINGIPLTNTVGFIMRRM